MCKEDEQISRYINLEQVLHVVFHKRGISSSKSVIYHICDFQFKKIADICTFTGRFRLYWHQSLLGVLRKKETRKVSRMKIQSVEGECDNYLKSENLGGRDANRHISNVMN